ncbi:hypothetical protein [Chryseobacterium sp.]|uniref:hypothetical protein n=1 Tax=Chryseobacterium sp. TaxID=1871047 RepID=UPI0025BE6CB8|nr:hypothetical protein [Chryseobacterium sp.]
MNRKALILFLYLYALAFSVLKTARFPNQWSVAHWMMDYRFGFIKRGLAGEIFGFFFEKNETNILILSVIILLLLYGVLLTIAIKRTNKTEDNTNRILFYSVFFLSQYIVFSAHLIGYLDHLIFLMTMIALYLIRNKKMIWASAVLSVGILIHEITFFLMLPICLFALIIKEIPEHSLSLKSINKKKLFEKMALFLLVPFIVLAGIIGYQECYGGNHHLQILEYLIHTGFINDKVASLVSLGYTESFTSFLAEESPHFIQRVFVSTCTIIYGIPMIFMGVMIYREFRKINFYIFGLLALACLSPLLLHAIAWDTYRIWSFPFMILFLGFWILDSKFNSVVQSGKISKWEILLFILSSALVSLPSNFLFDNEVERFSLGERILVLLPLFLTIFYLFKHRIQNFK